jgi:hypothetical protein
MMSHFPVVHEAAIIILLSRLASVPIAFRIALAPIQCGSRAIEQVTTGMQPMTKASRIELLSILLLGAFAVFALMRVASAQQVGREQDIVNLRLGQRIKVDDGTCPAGQIKEVSGSRMTPAGVERTRKCIPRLGPKSK